MTEPIVTKESLQHMLENPSESFVMLIVGKALVALLERQTEDEKADKTATERNGMGFSGQDAYAGTLSAKYFLKHGTLEDWMIEKWTRKNRGGFSRLTKYHRQLNEVAQAKLAKREQQQLAQAA